MNAMTVLNMANPMIAPMATKGINGCSQGLSTISIIGSKIKVAIETCPVTTINGDNPQPLKRLEYTEERA
jgi:hypothetical protein